MIQDHHLLDKAFAELYRNTAAVLVIWSLLIAGSLAWNYNHETNDTLELAKNEARAAVMQWENAIKRLEKQSAIDQQRLKTLERNQELAELEFTRLRSLYQKDKVGTRSGVEKA